MSPFEPDRATWQAWLHTFGSMCADFLAHVPSAPANGSIGASAAAIVQRVRQPIDETPLPGGSERIAAILREASQAALNTTGPGYLAYVPGGGLPAAAIADLVADVLNRFTGLTTAAPALCRLEADVIAWLCEAFGYGERARGLLTSGGSLANFSAIVTARHARFGDTADFSRACAYVSDQAHHSVVKSLALAGIPRANVRSVAVDQRLRMRPDDLSAKIRADRDAGGEPFIVVSAAGTTNTGAIDPIAAIGDTCAVLGVWHHVDAAYGGAFVLCDEGRRRLAGIDRADSITFDPHKGMFLPYGTGCLLVKDGEALRRAHGAGADYLQDLTSVAHRDEAPSPAEHGPELSRGFRGLRLWLPLMLHGAAAFRDALAEKLQLAERFHAGLVALREREAPIEIVDAPQLSTVPFRVCRRDGEPLAAWGRRNARWLAAINDRGRVYLSSTSLPVADGAAFTLRACVLSFRTHADRIDAALADIEASLDVV